ncbi:Xaa-Pro peptidase family protein [Psychrobium sp. MM17-31]|uniref:M24 family metallopeptidase n=1 Tax=Psychrobium sp. MM17-31 TaxID=2917758 RepID=UPI001EF437F7|nr:Xaa-Pro peptidase family protein [Psychrobium sp. MM17-31]MCG7531515.1 Xaa-Pro peptidase family protein [Psychrobium sp. MM17-31]
MSNGIGGATQQQALAKLSNMTTNITAPTQDEYNQRISRACELMQAQNIDAIYLNAGTNLTYFTGTAWYASERMVGALLTQKGDLTYIAPWFEESTLEEFMVVKAPVATWHEHESPYLLMTSLMTNNSIEQLAIDESTSFFIVDGIKQAAVAQGIAVNFINSKSITAGCRMQKSASELALMQRAKDMTMEVHKAAASILHEGITTTEVTDFINRAHQAAGAKGSSFCIVLFGEATAYPHGVKDPQVLKQGDMVLIDTGCLVHGYNSDITRSYVFGEATEKQRAVWQHEKDAQLAGFNAAKLGQACETVDIAARGYLESQGYGPEYNVPGLPHRTGHGCGLDIHEWPYLVRGDKTPLAPGMCFSNEPMICIYGEFGVRLEDHFYMTDSGPKWFTEPAYSIDDPFGFNA